MAALTKLENALADLLDTDRAKEIVKELRTAITGGSKQEQKPSDNKGSK